MCIIRFVCKSMTNNVCGWSTGTRGVIVCVCVICVCVIVAKHTFHLHTIQNDVKMNSVHSIRHYSFFNSVCSSECLFVCLSEYV